MTAPRLMLVSPVLTAASDIATALKHAKEAVCTWSRTRDNDLRAIQDIEAAQRELDTLQAEGAGVPQLDPGGRDAPAGPVGRPGDLAAQVLGFEGGDVGQQYRDPSAAVACVNPAAAS